VEQLLQAQGGKTLEDFELPIPAQLAAPGDAAVSEERARYNVMRQAQQLARDVPLLNQHQCSIYDNVIDAVHDPRPLDKTFFIDGLGRAGKTFLYGCLLSRVRSTGDIALSMASSSIAALLLEGGCTAHSRFKIPVVGLCGSSACYVPLNSPQSALIRAARLIVWDEAPMTHKHVFEAVNRTLQHVMGAIDLALKDMLFGGKVVVMGGDFKRILLVVPWGRRGQIVDANLKRSAVLWHRVKVC
jgi:ATP-dependent DNA helicase PIF1